MEITSKIAVKCRACLSSDLKVLLPLDAMPPGDKYAKSPEECPSTLLSSNIQRCLSCGHIQMSGEADPHYIYGNYLSRPAATNPALKSAYEQYSKELHELAAGHGILEVGSNDGLFLELFKNLGSKAVGIEPAENLCEFARVRGVATVRGYVSDETVSKAVDILGEKPSVILANHSFSNVIDIREWADALVNGLQDEGHLVLQTFYFKSVLGDYLIENFNHEHLSYDTVSTLTSFFGRYGLKLADARYLDAKGGSIRVYLRKTSKDVKPSESALALLNSESEDISVLDSLCKETRQYIGRIRNNFEQFLKEKGVSELSAYGTSINATVFIYQFGIKDLVKVFYDDDKLRQNLFSPGIGAPVKAGRSRDMNDHEYCVILAPLYAKAIVRNNVDYLNSGGKFILVRPDFRIISKEEIGEFL